ncbi:hypothetical protein GW17_00020847 [Ensete ventricosum]|nr:hypothetical protein GW17_00020847 [Ensete ventricosum]
MVTGWRNPSVCLNGRLFALDCRDGCKLRVYDAGAGSWSRHIDSKLHLGSSRALEAAALVPLNGKLCIVRNNMSITLVDVEARDGAGSEDQRWETIAGKGQLKTFVTNLFSNIAGRSSNRSYIVHCQFGRDSFSSPHINVALPDADRCLHLFFGRGESGGFSRNRVRVSSLFSVLAQSKDETQMEEITEGVNNVHITAADAHKSNRIQVSNTKKPLFFYVNLAKVRKPHDLVVL